MRKLIALLLALFAVSARAAINTTYAPLTYGCDTSTVTFPLTWQFIAGTDLSVSIKNSTTQIVTPLTYGVDYIVTGGNFATGSITTTGGYSPCPTNYTITIIRSTPRIQPTSFGTWGPTFSKSFQAAADRLALQIQEAGYLATNGTPGPTGATGATGTVSANSGFTLTGGNIIANAAGAQAITKSSGALTIGTTGNYALNLQTNGTTRLSFDGAGAMTMTGRLPQTGLPTITTAEGTTAADFTTTSQTWVDVPNLSATVVTTGRPVLIFFQWDGNGLGWSSNAGVGVNSGSYGSGHFQIVRDNTTTINFMGVSLFAPSSGNISVAFPAGVLNTIDASPSAGSHTYKLQAKANGNTYVMYPQVSRTKMIAFEL